MEIDKATEKRLNSLQVRFLRLVLRVGPGSPCAALLWDNYMLDMSLRVSIQKALLIVHIVSFDEETLAAMIYREKEAQNSPGLVQKTKQIFKELDIEDCNSINFKVCSLRPAI